MSTPTSREGTGDRRRQEQDLMDAATALLGEGVPYAKLSVGAIASRAGQTRTGFYQYFRDKRELLLATTDEFVAGLFTDADHWWSSTGGRAELHDALRTILAHFRGSRVLFLALMEAAGYDAEIAAYWTTAIGRFVDATHARLLRDDHDPATARQLAEVLVWMVERSCHLTVLDDDDTGDAARVDAMTTVWARTLSLEP